MNITAKKIKALNACSDGYDWYLTYAKGRRSTPLLRTLLDVDAHRPEWARWLYTRLMTRKQNIKLSIFCAKQVLPIFEDKHPDDLRPRKAIEAAERVLEHDTEENRQAAYYAAASAAYAAYASASANAARSAAYYAAYAAYYAASASANAAYYASSSDEKKLRQKIIRKAVKILERK